MGAGDVVEFLKPMESNEVTNGALYYQILLKFSALHSFVWSNQFKTPNPEKLGNWQKMTVLMKTKKTLSDVSKSESDGAPTVDSTKFGPTDALDGKAW